MRLADELFMNNFILRDAVVSPQKRTILDINSSKNAFYTTLTLFMLEVSNWETHGDENQVFFFFFILLAFVFGIFNSSK